MELRSGLRLGFTDISSPLDPTTDQSADPPSEILRWVAAIVRFVFFALLAPSLLDLVVSPNARRRVLIQVLSLLLASYLVLRGFLLHCGPRFPRFLPHRAPAQLGKRLRPSLKVDSHRAGSWLGSAASSHLAFWRRVIGFCASTRRTELSAKSPASEEGSEGPRP